MVKGSIGRWQADALSDIDLIIVTEPGRREAIWRERQVGPQRRWDSP